MIKEATIIWGLKLIMAANGSSPVAQWVKDPALSLWQLGLLLWHGFNAWPGNFHMLQAQQKKKKQKKPKNTSHEPSYQLFF